MRVVDTTHRRRKPKSVGIRSHTADPPPGCLLRAGNLHPAPTARPCPASAHPGRSGRNSASRCSFVPRLIRALGITYASCSSVMLPAPPKKLSGTQSGMMLAAGTRPVAGSGEPHTMRPESSSPDGPRAGTKRDTAKKPLSTPVASAVASLERELPRPASDAAFEPDQRAPQIDLLLGPAVAGLDQAATTSLGRSTPNGL